MSTGLPLVQLPGQRFGAGERDPYRRSPSYLALAVDDAPRGEVYRDLFRTAMDDAPLADLRMALN